MVIAALPDRAESFTQFLTVILVFVFVMKDSGEMIAKINYALKVYALLTMIFMSDKNASTVQVMANA